MAVHPEVELAGAEHDVLRQAHRPVRVGDPQLADPASRGVGIVLVATVLLIAACTPPETVTVPISRSPWPYGACGCGSCTGFFLEIVLGWSFCRPRPIFIGKDAMAV